MLGRYEHTTALPQKINAPATLKHLSNKNPLIGQKVKLATVVEGDPKALFSIATTPRCRGGCYSFPWIAPLYP